MIDNTQLKGILEEWKEEVSGLYKLLQETEEAKKKVSKEIKESPLGEQKKALGKKIKKIKSLIDCRRFEISGLEKAAKAISKGDLNRKTIKMRNIG